ncbi:MULTISPECIES: hypothetical protein [unclassified Simplicispira]|jgi:hypothetical protein|uniref:hypothetical protein n=1 Tax=unclassified Simplicispira TaxID=2630407 RepID=UPI000D5DE661|nr:MULTISPECIES: hypothetical protein [unclassified Simplicispira]MBH1979556.1 hypothetical protein [Comamonadaceae bacterium]PVY55132.1 hypothetical protein C8D04_0310 [Simplicispira sp. 125]REG16075.1 hypothetical protein C8D01_0619 [Simplicispira sp. 110]
MKSPIALMLAVALSSPLAALAATDAHDHGKSAPHKLELNAGKKWGTDDALRQAMSTIHQTVSQTLPTAHSGKAKVADYEAFGKDVTAQITYIVENCKLDPKADEQLHIIVADMMSGVEAAEGKEGEKKRAAGVVKVAQAANAYGKHFDHAGWKAIKVPH